MSASVAISSAAMANSAVALAIAEQAKTEACMAIIKQYNGKELQVTEMKEYAACIDKVYPAQYNDGDIMAAKVFIIVAFIGAIIGFIYGQKEEGFAFACLSAFVGLILAPIGLLFIVGIFQAVKFLFS